MAADPRRIKELFVATLDLPDPQARQAFLDRECGDDADLRQRLAALLQAHDAPAPALEQPLVAVGPETVSYQDPAEQVGTVIAGRYKLLEQIGEGGMGTVWVAEQTQPVRRKVALKLIKAGMDSKTVLARFEAERQALALMDHPNIAKVLDGGTTDSGRPFFVMEYVKGIPFTKYCDDARLTVAQRLALFVPVCQAVQHAHQKGIIHRDLKPSNILICLYDGNPVPKVIDFGLAKAMHQALTEHTVYTAHGVMMGTPLYMSPEQAELNNLDVDTRTDIYALGVILYELLTGTTPLEKQRFKQAAWQEMLRLIKEEEPPRPSARLSGSGSLPSMAAQRQLEPAKLTKLVRGELDWIVMKCLEKDRGRRYETATSLARDLLRYLGDEVVEARPPSASYRLRKFARRHKAPLLAAAGLLLFLIAGIIGTSWGLVRAVQARREAVLAQQTEAEQRRLAEAAEQKAHAATDAERQAREMARQREAETQAVLSFVENQVFAAGRSEGQEGGLGKQFTLRQAIEAALPIMEKNFTNQPIIVARLRMTLGRSFCYQSEAKIAAEQFQAARTLYTKHHGPDHPDTLRSMHWLANSYRELAQYAEAVKLHEETLALRKAKLGPNHPETLSSMHSLANSYADLGQSAEALKLREETLALCQAKLGPDHPETLSNMGSLANSYADVGRSADALKLREETLAIHKAKFGPDHPFTLSSMNNLANYYGILGRRAEAVKLHEETLALRKAKFGLDDPFTLGSMNNLANNYAASGRYAEALKLREEMLAIRKAKLGPEHPDTLGSMYWVAVSYARLGRHAEAVKLHEETLALRKAKLGPDHSDTLRSMTNLAIGYAALGRYADALKLCEETLALRQAKLGPNHAETADSIYNVACVQALMIPKSSDAVKQAALAMEWLKKSVVAGYTNVEHMKKDTDLDALRDRADFRKLLAELEKR